MTNLPGGSQGSAVRGPEGAEGSGGARPPAGPVTEADRAAALAQGTPRLPRKYIYWALAVVVVLGLGGTLLERVLSDAGLNPKATPVHTARPTPALPPTAATAPARAPELAAPLAPFMGLQSLHPAPALAIALVDQDGQAASLAAHRGSTVVLTFFDGPCNDICPVLAQEIRLAEADLGPAAARVSFLTVNTDPDALDVSALAPAAAAQGLGTLANWQMLTGPLAALDPIWRAYGVSITVGDDTGVVAHNDVMYFIDARGDLRYRATPFANETADGTYSLPSADVTRWAHGIARYAGRLAGAA